MHSAIIVIEMPDDQTRWDGFRANLMKGKPPPHYEPELEGAVRLAENVWLVNFAENHATFVQIVAAAGDRGLTYGILPLDAETQWLPGGFDPKTIQGRSG